MYKIILADGTIIDNLELNGNNYISSQIIGDSVFENNLDEITVFDGENTQTQKDIKLINNVVVDGKSWFILTAKTQEEKEKEELTGVIDDLVSLLVAKGVVY